MSGWAWSNSNAKEKGRGNHFLPKNRSFSRHLTVNLVGNMR